jgi:hypothetical protein
MVNALKWLVKFLETRFPEKVGNPASKEALEALRVATLATLDTYTAVVNAQAVEIKKLKEQVEILNLRVGLTRATQSPFGRKVNG